MEKEINLLGEYPKIERDYDKRLAEKTPDVVRIAKQFGREFFDGERKFGYGGYKYDGRWKAVVKRMKTYYNLADNSVILDIGCGKGFMLYDFQQLMPGAVIAGIDISSYAVKNSLSAVRPFLKIASAENLPYQDKSFDLVISINSIHNLPPERLKTALREIRRVSRGNSYITVDAWHNEAERQNLFKWVLTAETMMHVDDWKRVFEETGYTGDYYWFIAD